MGTVVRTRHTSPSVRNGSCCNQQGTFRNVRFGGCPTTCSASTGKSLKEIGKEISTSAIPCQEFDRKAPATFLPSPHLLVVGPEMLLREIFRRPENHPTAQPCAGGHSARDSRGGSHSRRKQRRNRIFRRSVFLRITQPAPHYSIEYIYHVKIIGPGLDGSVVTWSNHRRLKNLWFDM